MQIAEPAFKIGCGRYLQGEGVISGCGSEVLRLGSVPLIIGDETSLVITREVIERSVSDVCDNYKIITHNETCSEERAKEIAALKSEIGYDVIVGTGGGVIMDFAKLCGYFAKCPVINIPTSSATCAAYTALSVRYTPDGRTIGPLFYSYEVDAVIADTEILSKQPERLLLAGVFDALAKLVEIKQYYNESTEDYPLGLDYAYVLSKRTYKLLESTIDDCINDMRGGVVTPRLDNLIFTSISVTGLISGIARGSNQCALAHKFYDNTRVLFPETARPFLHGEIVGVGLLLQNYFNGEEESNEKLLELMKKHGMPYRITDVGIRHEPDIFEKYFKLLASSGAIDEGSKSERTRLRVALDYLWNIV